MNRFRGRLEAALPDGWLAKDSITLLAPDGQANVIASSEPLSPDTDVDTYMSVQGELLSQEFPEYEEIALTQTELLGGGRKGFVRRFDWTPPDGQRVCQFQLYYVENGRGYTLTATAPGDAFLRYEAELLRILQDVQLVR